MAVTWPDSMSPLTLWVRQWLQQWWRESHQTSGQATTSINDDMQWHWPSWSVYVTGTRVYTYVLCTWDDCALYVNTQRQHWCRDYWQINVCTWSCLHALYGPQSGQGMTTGVGGDKEWPLVSKWWWNYHCYLSSHGMTTGPNGQGITLGLLINHVSD